MVELKEQLEIMAKGADEIIGLEDLESKLKKSIENNKPLTIKLGLDPSAPDIHLGHAVVLRKIKQMQDLGHRAVIILGDFTGMIGDPTGKSKTRKQLDRDKVLENAKTYKEQLLKILDPEKTEVKFNSEWLSKLNFADVLSLASKCTVARMMEREDFKNRFQNGQSIGIHEFFYPLMQAMDSVELKADIELGGTDQRFNLLMGRNLQKEFQQEPQVVMMMPLLEGTDGTDKMSKSLGNYIGIEESAIDIFNKTMTIPDDMIIKYFQLATDVHPRDINVIKERLESGENPKNIKLELASIITEIYHGKDNAEEAKQNFIKVFEKKQNPTEIKEVELSTEDDLLAAMVKGNLCASRSEARRLVVSGAVKINDEKVEDFLKIQLKNEDIINVGKFKFIKVIKK
ncbi:tyrosine--tRNA ligase [Inconstantimicrobium mannanitabidum]|uniref:Tyrosine--tRNA ligase n=1 Tax=Inconstantimicrobium mannanitabidum TaxID=1604901 RepID=A0ACB5RHS5_9CLOT|nr:tyrosine--tRNA ligase [Clostridium sp. TW13]GKX68637.1 tyrosine--tRNA ligase [Clostridium sp. TW13]